MHDKGCEVCDSICEVKGGQDIDAVEHPRKTNTKAKVPDPSVFRLSREKQLHDNTTKF